MKKIAVLVSLMLGVPSVSMGQLPARNVQITCQSLTDFANGKFDLIDPVFGANKEDWDYIIAKSVKQTARNCAQASMNAMLAQKTYTTPRQYAILDWEKKIDDKADRIAAQNQRDAQIVIAQKRAAEDQERVNQIAVVESERKAKAAILEE